jgi:hypothetical protein
MALAATSASAALVLTKWEAGTCANVECTDAGNQSFFYTQAAGHPDFGITDFAFKSKAGLVGAQVPEGKVKDVRVDLPPGLSVDPEATEQCTEGQLDEFKCPAGSEVGVDKATGTAELTLGIKTTVTEEFPVYNMVRRAGQPARFGVELNSVTLRLVGLQGHIFLEGGISWYSEPQTSENSGVPTGDFHEYFKIQNIPQQPEIVESRLIFWGVPQEHTHVGSPRAFITLPSTCTVKPVTHLHVDSYESPGSFIPASNQTPVAATGCGSLAFNPSLSLGAETSTLDEPDGAGVDLHIPQPLGEPSKPDSPDLQTAVVTLPPGMSLNPSAAHGLVACTSQEIAIGSNAAIKCPSASVIGSVSVNAPGIPAGALAGSLYLAPPEPGHGPESGGEFRVYLAAFAPAYGVGLRLEGRVRANVATGQLTATFAGTPQVPFEDFKLQLRSESRIVLANPLACGPAQPHASLTAFTGQVPAIAGTAGFTVTAAGSGKCALPLPFALTQTTAASVTQAGAYGPFALDFGRKDGQQYPAQISTTLPEGLLGAISSVKLCGEPHAAHGECPSTSQIGTVSALAGSGNTPYPFAGKVFLTGPYQGAPFGLSIVVPAVAGPYNLGNLKVRGRIDVGRYDGRITATAAIPSVFEGVPLRVRSLHIAVSRHEFLFNPTSCGHLETDTTLTSTEGATQTLETPFQPSGCNKLAFTPAFAAAAGGHPSKQNGTSFEVRVTQPPHQGNIREVMLQLPKELPSRLSTLQQACPIANFEAGPPPGTCLPAARVGSATVSTPVLPVPLSGPAYLVSHGGEAFPDLDLILSGDGVNVVLVGHTHIASKTGITTSTFETLPDVPINSVDVSLPAGPLSVLGASGSLCGRRLMAPTTIVSQSGATVKRETPIALSGCPLTIVSHRTSGRRAILRILAPSAGRLTISGRGLRTVKRTVKAIGVVTVSVPLSKAAVTRLDTLAQHHRMSIKVRVAFLAHGARKPTLAPLKIAFRHG